MIDEEQESFTGPFGTLFFLRPGSLRIQAWDEGEATVPREDVVAFVRFCVGGGFATLTIESLAARPLTDDL